MLSVVIPTFESERSLPRTLACLVTPTVQGLVRDVIVADGGSRDQTALIAEETGAHFLTLPKSCSAQLKAGAALARASWLLFLYPGTVLDPGWAEEAGAFMEASERCSAGAPERAGAFRFAVDEYSSAARLREHLVALRTLLFALPYGDQGLLIPKRFYDRLGGHPDVADMEDVALARAIGRHRLAQFRTAAVTPPQPAHRLTWMLQPLRNFTWLSLYSLGVPPHIVGRWRG